MLKTVEKMLAIPNRLQKVNGWSQGHNKVRWRPGQEASLASPFSHLRSFGSKCIVLNTCDIVRTLRRPQQWFGARGIVPLLVTPLVDPAAPNCDTLVDFAVTVYPIHV